MAILACCVFGDLLGVKQAVNLYLYLLLFRTERKALRVSRLMLGLMNGRKEIVRMLVDHRGVFLLATNDCGDTALRYVFHSVPYSIM